MIDGLKFTLSGGELRALLDARARRHDERAEWWTHERTRAGADDDRPELPDRICSNEAERHAWRADVLRFMRDHVDAAETYRLTAADLETGELMPPRPAWLEQDEHEASIRPAKTLRELSTTLDEMVGAAYAMIRAYSGDWPCDRPAQSSGGDEARREPLHMEHGRGAVVVDRQAAAPAAGAHTTSTEALLTSERAARSAPRVATTA